MLTILYAPDGTSSWTASGVLTLCNTTRNLAELDVKFNHKRSISVEQLATALGSGTSALAQDFGNIRNTLSLKVRRGVDFTATAFPDPEGALSFMLQYYQSFTTTGTLKISLVGITTNISLYLLNVGVEGINLDDWLGVAPAITHTFNGGLITTSSPF